MAAKKQPTKKALEARRLERNAKSLARYHADPLGRQKARVYARARRLGITFEEALAQDEANQAEKAKAAKKEAKK